jgi:hypothetical protein
VSESTDGGITTSEWKTEVPLAVVGFSIGDFTKKEVQFNYPQGGGLTVDAYANTMQPDFIGSGPHGVLGTLNTTPMLATELSQGEVASQIYTSYFGQLPFSHITLTQQSACNYGQSWPMLVYLPICGFFDDTQRHFLLGSSWYDTYWKVVTPHEVAHQWWGQTVGFRSYRDQWMSEVFANNSGISSTSCLRRRTPSASGLLMSVRSRWASGSARPSRAGASIRISSIPRDLISCT